jgi:hypothetical protein
LKKISLLLLIILSGLNCYAQKYNLKINGSKPSEAIIIDSINYATKHIDAKGMQDEISKTQDFLIKKGYLETKTVSNNNLNDSSYVVKLSLGIKTITIQLTISAANDLKKIIGIEKDSLVIPYPKLEYFLNEKKSQLEAAGYPLSTFKLSNISKTGTVLNANLEIIENKRKTINSIQVAKNTSQKFHLPDGHLKQINKKFQNAFISQNNINKIKDEFAKYNFVRQTKYPETLFTEDSTKVYVYLEKQNANNFDGFIGFNNNQSQKISISGYLDLKLENSINAGEEFRLNWKSDGNSQRTFNTSLEIPYLLRSPLGLKAQINIFKQDSTFQNTRTSLELSYFIKYNIRFYIGRESTSSSDIQNSNNGTISDFKSNFITSSFQYILRDRNNYMNPVKASINLKLGIGRRENTNVLTADNINRQNYIELRSNYTLYFSKKNHFNINGIFLNLNSKSFGTNELYRFGGINSMRGFQENSLQAKTYLVLATEYRYLLNSNFYINTVTDYGYYNLPLDPTTNNFNKNLISAGLGIGLLTKSGLIKISAVKNYNKEAKSNIYNTLVHLSYNVNF